MSWTWQWQSDNGFVDFGKQYSDQLEQDYLDGLSTTSLYIGDQSYTSQKKRVIQRVQKDAPKKVEKKGIKNKKGLEEDKQIINLLKSGDYSDLEIIDNRGISHKCHKFVISQNSQIESMIKDTSILMAPFDTITVHTFLEFCYGVPPEISKANVLPLYLISKFFSLDALEKIVFMGMVKPLKDDRMILEIISQLEENVRKETKLRFQPDKLKERLFNMFKWELLDSKEKYDEFHKMDDMLKSDLISWSKTELEKIKMDATFQLVNSLFPDFNFISKEGKEVPAHRALFSLEDKNFAKGIHGRLVCDAPVKYLEHLIDYMYKGASFTDLAKGTDFTGLTEFLKSINLGNLIEAAPKTYFGKKPSGLAFDPEYCSDNCTISEDGRSVTYNGPDGFQGAVLMNYAETWTVKLGTPAGYLMIGMCTHEMKKTGCNYSSNYGYYLYLGTGGLYGSGVSNTTFTSSSWGVQGTVIKMTYDPNEGTLSYCMNGQDLGVAYRNLAGKELYPAFDFYNKGSLIEIVDE